MGCFDHSQPHMKDALDKIICLINANGLHSFYIVDSIEFILWQAIFQYSIFQNKLTFHPVINDFLSLLGRAFGKPVVTKQHRHLIGVDQFPRHEGQRPKGNLL